MAGTFEEWLEDRGASVNTRVQYMSRVKALEGSRDPAAEAVRLLTGRGERTYAPKSLRMMKAAMVSWARYRGDTKLLERLADVKLPPAVRARAQAPLPPEIYRVVRDEISKADYITDPTRACLGMMARRGLRRSDALGLQRADVVTSLKRGTLSYVVKGGRRLEIGVLKGFRPCLQLLVDHRDWSEAHELVSSTKRGAQLAIPRALRKIAEHVDLGDEVVVDDVRAHILRRSYAVTFFAACGNDPTKLQSHMGWANVQTALSYVDFARREELDEIADKMMEDE